MTPRQQLFLKNSNNFYNLVRVIKINKNVGKVHFYLLLSDFLFFFFFFFSPSSISLLFQQQQRFYLLLRKKNLKRESEQTEKKLYLRCKSKCCSFLRCRLIQATPVAKVARLKKFLHFTVTLAPAVQLHVSKI